MTTSYNILATIASYMVLTHYTIRTDSVQVNIKHLGRVTKRHMDVLNKQWNISYMQNHSLFNLSLWYHVAKLHTVVMTSGILPLVKNKEDQSPLQNGGNMVDPYFCHLNLIQFMYTFKSISGTHSYLQNRHWSIKGTLGTWEEKNIFLKPFILATQK